MQFPSDLLAINFFDGHNQISITGQFTKFPSGDFFACETSKGQRCFLRVLSAKEEPFGVEADIDMTSLRAQGDYYVKRFYFEK